MSPLKSVPIGLRANGKLGGRGSIARSQRPVWRPSARCVRQRPGETMPAATRWSHIRRNAMNAGILIRRISGRIVDASMPLSLGTRVGPYEIVSLLGRGGMGEVYKARDTRLDRPVAIKISQERYSERLEREARAIAALNHPHICSLFDPGPDCRV